MANFVISLWIVSLTLDKTFVFAATGGLVPFFKYTRDLHSPETAQEWCSSHDMSLPSPQNSEEQEDLVTYIQQNGISEVWLDATQTVYPWYWKSNGMARLDQGCYRLEESAELSTPVFTSTSHMDFNRCLQKCANNSQTEVGIAIDLSNKDQYLCSCGREFSNFKLAPPSKCPSKEACPAGVSGYCGGDPYHIRIFHIGGEVSLPLESSTSSQLCGSLMDDNGVHIRTSKCRDKRKYLCRLPKAGDFVNCYESMPGGCLVTHMALKTWFEARYDCMKQGGDLAHVVPTTDLKNLQLWEAPAFPSDNYWVGITASHWTWRESGKDVKYTRWADGEPGDPFGHQCIALGSTGKWTSSECSQHRPVLCMKYSAPLTTKPDSSSAGSETGGTNIGTATTPATPSDDGNQARTIGLIVGIILAALALVALVAFLVLLRRKRKAPHKTSGTNPKITSETPRSIRGIDGPYVPEDDDLDENYVNRPQSSYSVRNSDTEVKRVISASSGTLDPPPYPAGERENPEGFGPNDGAGVVVNPLFDEVLDSDKDSPVREPSVSGGSGMKRSEEIHDIANAPDRDLRTGAHAPDEIVPS